MRKFRFVGTTAEIGDRRLTRLGEEVVLSAEDARQALDGGVALLPEAMFNSVGFTEQELSIYAWPGQRIDTPEAFEAKLRKAHALIGKEEVSE
ncbi:MAG: hypothetical protein IT168_33275 [Bryobacterales bacterium]|nr:hypothetical protein [Bryobacterales bacterium]